MEELVAVASQMRQGLSIDAERKGPRQRPRLGLSKRARCVLFGTTFFVLAFCPGSIQFLGWSGKHTKKLSQEQALAIARMPDTFPSQVATLIAWISDHTKRGIDAIHRMRELDGLRGQRAAIALTRLKSLLFDAKLDRRNARRFPSWLAYAASLTTLGNSPPATSHTWDCLEVVVYNIEESFLLFQSKGLPSDPDDRAAAASLKLRMALRNR